MFDKFKTVGTYWCLVSEYSALNRLGISDAKAFVKRHFPNEKLLLLEYCAVGKQLLDKVEGSVEEAISSLFWIDIMVCLVCFGFFLFIIECVFASLFLTYYYIK